MSPARVPSFAEAYAAVKPLWEMATKQGLKPEQAIRAAEYTLSWCAFVEEHGHRPTVAQHAEVLSLDERNYYRHRAQWRQAFPGYEAPDELPEGRALMGEAPPRTEPRTA